MISIIVCSRKPDIPDNLKFNVTETIGVDYELIVIDNSENKYSIFSAYNEGVRRAKYPFLCFMHEDILYHTQDWGTKVIEHFKDDKVGLIGVAGGHYVPRLPGSHWSSGITSYNVIHNVDGKQQQDIWRYTKNRYNSASAVLVDGLWFCVSKIVMDKVQFDEKTFSGFHCYDADICMQIHKLNYEVRIVFDISVEHFSLGTRNSIWLRNIFMFYKKWKKDLPILAVQLSKYKISEANYLNARELIEQIQINDFGRINILKVLLSYIRINPPLNRRNYRYMKMLFQIL